MCGIAGLMRIDPRNSPGQESVVLHEALMRMVDQMGHRGPDGRGVVEFRRSPVQSGNVDGIGLGHTRLAILDLSPSGSQPMGDALNGNGITYNGEVYNFRALHTELAHDADGDGDRSAVFHSRSDTEVVL